MASFKKKSRPVQNSRKRALDEDGTEERSAVVKASQKQGYNPLRQATAGYKSKKAKLESSDSEADVEEQDEKAGQDFRVKFAATRTVNAEDEVVTGEEAALLAETLAARDDGLYHGQKAYRSQLPSGSTKYTALAGPSNIRQITITDYQPDVCKDYKETGFCGFGDSCKFLHDRGDYLQGWQLDNIYLSNRPTANAADPPPEAEEDLLPFACLICRQPFTDPIVTKCGHYFDSHCAIARYAKTPKCFACGTPTGGLFNKADKIFKKREKAMEMRQRADAAEEDMINGGGADAIEGLAEEAPPEPVGDFQQEGSEEESGSEREFEEEE